MSVPRRIAQLRLWRRVFTVLDVATVAAIGAFVIWALSAVATHR